MLSVIAEMLTVDQLVLFLIFFIPGFIAVKTYDLFVPHERRDWQNALFEVIGYSTLNFVAISALAVLLAGIWNLLASFAKAPPIDAPPLFWVSALRNVQTSLYSASLVYLLLLFVVLLGMPALLSFTVYKASNSQKIRGLIHRDPMPTVWDSVFSYSKLPENDDGYFVIVYLKEGTKVGGFYGGTSSASCYPYDNQIFLQKGYTVTDNGLGDPIKGSAGILVCSDDIARIEFYNPE